MVGKPFGCARRGSYASTRADSVRLVEDDSNIDTENEAVRRLRSSD
jgi:hypothetical protein